MTFACMRRTQLSRCLLVGALPLISAIGWPSSANAEPIALSGTVEATPAPTPIYNFAVGEAFSAVMDLHLSEAVGEPEVRPGITGDGMRYKGIGGSVVMTIAGVSQKFTPLLLIIGNDFVDDAGKVPPSPLDLWHLHLTNHKGLVLTIGLWQREGSAIDDPALFVPNAAAAFGSATWSLLGPPSASRTGNRPPPMDVIATGLIEDWAPQVN